MRDWYIDVSASSGFADIHHPLQADLSEAAQRAVASCTPYYDVLRWQTQLAMEGRPLLSQQSDADVALLCIALQTDLLPKLLGASHELPAYSPRSH